MANTEVGKEPMFVEVGLLGADSLLTTSLTMSNLEAVLISIDTSLLIVGLVLLAGDGTASENHGEPTVSPIAGKHDSSGSKAG